MTAASSASKLGIAPIYLDVGYFFRAGTRTIYDGISIGIYLMMIRVTDIPRLRS